MKPERKSWLHETSPNEMLASCDGKDGKNDQDGATTSGTNECDIGERASVMGLCGAGGSTMMQGWQGDSSEQ